MFDLKANGTSVKTEVVAGATTFFTMAYVTVVNPLILSQAGVPFEQSFTATIIAAVIGTLLMGLVARYPIAVAPGMGLNAYFTYSVVQGHAGLGYIEAFSAVFIAGILFLVLSMTSLRRRLIEMIPANLKHAITVGIGLFIAFIGLRMSGIITA
ncbi:NCS2 family permease, partial [Clostridium perfringens]